MSDRPDDPVSRLEARLELETRARLQAQGLADRTVRALADCQREFELTQRITFAANLGSSAREVLQQTLALLCEYTGWPVGHVFRVEGQALRSLEVWHLADPTRFQVFCEATRSIPLHKGVGLPGRVLESGQPLWVRDVTADSTFQRAGFAKDLNVRAGFAFPIVIGDEVVAVAEFFDREAVEPDEALLALVRLVGVQIGRVFERERADQRVRFDAMHDAMCGLPNRTLLLDRLAQALARVKRHPEACFAVLSLDLDRFKLVNDGLGHLAGDDLLRAVSARLLNVVRAHDTVARLGGDEFAVLLEHTPDEKTAVAVVERMVQALTEPLQVHAQDVVVSASVGVTMWDARYERAEEMLRDAETAMYEAKNQGKGRHVVFTNAMHDRAAKRLGLESDLRRALEAREFELFYQPIVSLSTGALTGFEALIRWRHPTVGMISPLDFIPAAEESGLIVPIGRWVVEEACAQWARWQALGAGPLSLSVNISGVQFRNERLVSEVADSLARHGVDPGQLKLEITESVLLDARAAERVLAELKALGVGLALDDFGTGYSSLSHLHRFPFEVLKIDRSFVSAMHNGPKHRDIVRAILLLSQAMHLAVVAEGVETLEQAKDLASLGCGHVQGFYFAKPLPAAEATALLASGKRWTMA